MLKLLFLLMFPGFLAEFWRRDFHENSSRKNGKSIANGFFFSYILFLADITVIFLGFHDRYPEFLSFLQRETRAIQDVFCLMLFGLIQLLIASVLGIAARIVEHKSIERAFLRMGNLQKRIGFAAIGGFLIATVLTFTIKDNAEQRLVMNEVCSRNDKVLADESGEYRDYIELYNPSGYPILLKGFQLSDSVDLKGSMTLEEAVIEPGGYYIIWTDGAQGFGISSKGESLYLANSVGTIVDSVTIPELDANMAYARTTDGVSEWSEELPSPLAENNPKRQYLENPVFSAESGFYDEEFLLSIQAGEGQKIYYTLDGSVPDENSTLYTDEILVYNPSSNPNVYKSVQNIVKDWLSEPVDSTLVDKLYIVRAIAMDDYGNTSDVVTKSYLVGLDHYKDKYVLSLVSDPDDLFGDNGIYVTGKEYDDWYLGNQEGPEPVANFLKKGKEYEIDATIALFYNELLMEQDAGLRIQGASRRAYPEKRFSVFARKEYSGSRFFEYDLFGKEMHAFFMRPDFIDALIQELVSDRNMGTLQAKPVSVFLDGEFWYNNILREKYNEDYLSATYGVESSDVLMAESIPEEIYTFLAEHDLSRASNYEQFCEMVDVQSYIDYLAANIYVCNMDTSESKNCRMWKTLTNSGQGYSDGKWRFLIYDTDSVEWNSIGFYGALRFGIDSFAQEKEYAGIAYNQEPVYKALRTNPEFCRQFVLTFMDLANVNFAVEKVKESMAVWGVDISWNDGFFENRFDSIVPALAKEFGLTGTLEEITLKISSENAGAVTINTTAPKLKDGSWTGKYYTDYPVTITATAKEGYEFVGWRNGQQLLEEAQISVQLETGGCTWEAVFKEKEK